MRLTITDILKELEGISPEISNLVEHRLEIWAKWYREKNQRTGLEFPSTTIEYKMMKYGCQPPEKPGPKPLPTNEAAEEMEAIISIMARQKGNQLYAAALREYYLGGGKKSRREDAARRMGITRLTFYNYLKAACGWLAGWFTSELTTRLIKHRAKIKKFVQAPM